jgi:hypothetical protein
MGGAETGAADGAIAGAVVAPVTGALCPRVRRIRTQLGLAWLPVTGLLTPGRPVPRG